MPLAFCILAHKNPAQVERLIRAIWAPENLYVLHYDRRAPKLEHRVLRGLVERFPGLILLPAKYVNWGGFSQMQVQLDMMAFSLCSDVRWTHLLTLSGQDFPLRRVREIEGELGDADEVSFLSWFDPLKERVWSDALDRLTQWHFDSVVLEHVLRIPGFGRRVRACCGWTNRRPVFPGLRRPIPDFFHWYGGANHYVLSRQAVNHLLHDDKAKRIADWLRRSGSPDESYVQSALLNRPCPDNLVNDDRRAIFWDKGKANPRILVVNDLPALRRARNDGKLFARKFDLELDGAIVDALESDLNK